MEEEEIKEVMILICKPGSRACYAGRGGGTGAWYGRGPPVPMVVTPRIRVWTVSVRGTDAWYGHTPPVPVLVKVTVLANNFFVVDAVIVGVVRAHGTDRLRPYRCSLKLLIFFVQFFVVEVETPEVVRAHGTDRLRPYQCSLKLLVACFDFFFPLRIFLWPEILVRPSK